MYRLKKKRCLKFDCMFHCRGMAIQCWCGFVDSGQRLGKRYLPIWVHCVPRHRRVSQGDWQASVCDMHPADHEDTLKDPNHRPLSDSWLTDWEDSRSAGQSAHCSHRVPSWRRPGCCMPPIRPPGGRCGGANERRDVCSAWKLQHGARFSVNLSGFFNSETSVRAPQKTLFSLSIRFPSSSWSCQCPYGCGTVVKRYII